MDGYRATMFDGESGLRWLSPGWRGLRFYARKAKDAIKGGDIATKAQMIYRASCLLNLMTGILDTSAGTSLGPRLMKIYAVLGETLLRANVQNDVTALDEFETALAMLDHDMLQNSKVTVAA